MIKAYLDSNVLIAAAVQGHPRHATAFAMLSSGIERAFAAYTSQHTLLEVYAVLTRAPFQPRIQPLEAMRFLDETILPHFEIVNPSTGDYKTLLRACSSAGRSGAIVYDALHIQCAKRANCDRIYTFNVDHFRSLAEGQWRGRISSP